ncbi:MAG TPA: methyltransferase domain-containing protein [Phaeodactylibacter sp.]|nr:methyltransferase domain-containing protein [Phaeodactylibacter sp.]
MQQFWDERYASSDYVYGEAPNRFLAEQLPGIPPGKALFPAEGEGRNAAYAASLGWEVDAFDYSQAAQRKATQLFERKGVQVNYTLSSVEAYLFKPHHYNLVFLCYAHLPPQKRTYLHQQAAQALRKGGWILLEGFHKEQLGRSSGGPKKEEMLFSLDQLEKDFGVLDIRELEKRSVHLEEGDYHQGEAAVVRMIARKL